MKSKRCFFGIADKNNIEHFNRLVNSMSKFHNEEIKLFNETFVEGTKDPSFYYRATPVCAQLLMDEGYTEVCKIDADSIVTGNLDHIWEGDYDVAVVNNSNPREMKTYPVNVWDIHPLTYVNCGFVVMKNKKFVDHWKNLCYSPHFGNYQMREQDLLNIMVFYGDYKVRLLDASDKWHGLISKQYWAECVMKDGNIVLPKNDEWPKDEDKTIKVIHFAGGNQEKGNYKIRFTEEVSNYLDTLVR